MGKKFNFGESPVAKVAEEIREETHSTNQPLVIDTTTQTVDVTEKKESVQTEPDPQPVIDQSKPTSRKSENGIVINVPMDIYTQLVMLKFATGRTLKELALQAVKEFVEKNKVG